MSRREIELVESTLPTLTAPFPPDTCLQCGGIVTHRRLQLCNLDYLRYIKMRNRVWQHRWRCRHKKVSESQPGDIPQSPA